jgi:hypothetical protein
MTHDDQEIHSALPAAESGLSRRGLLRTAGGIGIAGAAAGMFIGTGPRTGSGRVRVP